MDAASLLLINPESLFSSFSYKHHENMSWSDINSNPLAPIVYEMFNLTVSWSSNAKETFFAGESEQIVLNRQRLCVQAFY